MSLPQEYRVLYETSYCSEAKNKITSFHTKRFLLKKSLPTYGTNPKNIGDVTGNCGPDNTKMKIFTILC